MNKNILFTNINEIQFLIRTRSCIESEVHKKIMNDLKYHEVQAYLMDNTLPECYDSTKSNFVAMARNYELNRQGNLMRKNKMVVKFSMREEIFNALHNHSGRTACWERINAR